MATTTLYTKFPAKILNAEVDWDTDTFKVALVTSSYTPDQDAHDYWDDVSSNEASGTGYTAGGATLGSKTITQDSATNKQTFDAADVSWTTSTVTARYAVIYKSTGTPSTSPLVGYVDFGSNQSSTAGTFTVQWSASGIFATTV